MEKIMRKITKGLLAAAVLLLVTTGLVMLCQWNILAKDDPDFTNEDGTCTYITYEDGEWIFSEPIYGGMGPFYVSADRVLELLRKNNDCSSLILYSNPTSKKDKQVLKDLLSISSTEKEIALNYISIAFDPGKENFSLDLSFTCEIEVSYQGTGSGQIILNDPGYEEEGERYGFCKRLVLNTLSVANIVYNGNLRELYANNCKKNTNIVVNGNLDELQIYGKNCKDYDPFLGTLKVTGTVNGCVYGIKEMVTEDFGTLSFDMPCQKIVNQTGQILSKGSVVCQYEMDSTELSVDMFDFTYQTISDENCQRWLVTLSPNSEALADVYPVYIDLVNEDGTGVCQNFSADKIRPGSELIVGGTDYMENQTLSIDVQLSTLRVEAGIVKVNKPVGYLEVQGTYYCPGMYKVPYVDIAINARISELVLVGRCYAGNVVTKKNGYVVEGDRVPLKGDTRKFVKVGGNTTLMKDGTLSVVSYGAQDEIGVVIPNEEQVAEYTESSYVALSLKDQTETTLKNKDETALNNALIGTQYDVVGIVDMKVEAYEVDENGAPVEDSFQNITDLSNEIEFTYDLTNSTKASDNCYVVRLHEDDKGNVTGTVVAEADGKSQVTFETAQFSKYIVVKMPKSAVPSTTIKSVATSTKGTKLTWKKVNSAKGYLVYRRIGKGAFKKIKKLTSNTVTTYLDTAAKNNGAIYTYRVVAYKVVKNKTVMSLASQAKTIAYLTMDSINTVSSSTTGISLSWKRNAKASGYVIYRKEANGKYKTYATISGNKKTSLKDTKVKNGVAYSYKICSYVKYGGKNYLASSTSKIKSYRYLAPITVKKATQKNKTITLSWKSNTKVTGYQVELSTSKDFKKTTKATIKKSQNAYTFKNLKKGTYYVRVRGYYKSGKSLFYATWTTKTVKVS